MSTSCSSHGWWRHASSVIHWLSVISFHLISIIHSSWMSLFIVSVLRVLCSSHMRRNKIIIVKGLPTVFFIIWRSVVSLRWSEILRSLSSSSSIATPHGVILLVMRSSVISHHIGMRGLDGVVISGTSFSSSASGWARLLAFVDNISQIFLKVAPIVLIFSFVLFGIFFLTLIVFLLSSRFTKIVVSLARLFISWLFPSITLLLAIVDLVLLFWLRLLVTRVLLVKFIFG